MEAIDRTYHFKKTLEKKERFVGGHRLCAGCGAGIAVRGVLRALREEDRAVVGNATGCLEVSSFLYPYTAYEDSYIHTAFESAGATLSGVEAALQRPQAQRPGEGGGQVHHLRRGRGNLRHRVPVPLRGHGAGPRPHLCLLRQRGLYEHRHPALLLHPPGLPRPPPPRWAPWSPARPRTRRTLTDIIAAHNVPYVAQTTFIGNFRDLYTKAQKAIYTPGPSFLNIMAPCPRGWEYPAEKLPEICKLAVETCVLAPSSRSSTGCGT